MNLGPLSDKFCVYCGKGWDGSFDDLMALGFSHDEAVKMVETSGGTPPCEHIKHPGNRADSRSI